MSTQRAIIIQDNQTAKIIPNHPIPTLRPDFVLVKIHAVALNPTDWKHIARGLSPGSLSGCDFAGTVEAIPEGNLLRSFKVGDRVCGTTHGANGSDKETGTFAEHIIVKSGTAIPIPENLSFEEAATLGVGVISCASGLYQKLQLPLPGTEAAAKQNGAILIYGGSTATGTLAVQYAKLSGYTVIATASSHNFPLLRSLGADYVIDYKSPDAISTIQSLTSNNLRLVFDCVGEAGSPEFCYKALTTTSSDLPIRYSTLIPPPVDPTKTRKPTDAAIEISGVMAYAAYGERFEKFGQVWEKSDEDYEFASRVWEVSAGLLAEGKLKPHPMMLKEGGVDGLEGVLNGLKYMQEGKVSGVKLVYRV